MCNICSARVLTVMSHFNTDKILISKANHFFKCLSLSLSLSLFFGSITHRFYINYVAISFTLGSEHKFCSSFWKPQKLWLHFSSLITSPHAPFIYLLSCKKVIGLEAVLTCFVGSSSENHSSGIPFSYKLLQFPVEVSHWVGHLPQVFRLFSANALQVFLPTGPSGNDL